MNPKQAGKAFESEIEKDLMDLVGQTRDGDARFRTRRIFSSGNAMSDKGDVITCIDQLPKQILIECKRRRTKSKKQGVFFSLDYSWLDKIKEEAERRGCIPLFVFAFTGVKKNRIWAMYQISNPLCLPLLIQTPVNIELVKKKNSYYIYYKDLIQNKMFTNQINDYMLVEWQTFLNELGNKIKEVK